MIASHYPRPASLSRHRDENPATVTPLHSHPYKCPLPQTLSFDILTNARGGWGCARSFALFCHSLHQECFTTPFPSSGSTLFLKTAGVSPNNSHSGSPRAISAKGTQCPPQPSGQGSRRSDLWTFRRSDKSRHKVPASLIPSLPTESCELSTAAPVDKQRVASHNSPSALSPSMAPITEEGE